MELYLPEEWANDPARREKAGVPEAVKFETKPNLALRMIARVRERVAHAFIGADAGYGCDGDFRAQLREWNEPYVVGVRPTDIRLAPETRLVTPPRKSGPGAPPGPRLPPHAKPLSAHEWAKKAKWSSITWATGADGEPLTARVARFRVRVTVKAGKATDETGWLLLEERQNELKSWICWGVDDKSLEDLVRMAHHRWTIEHAYETMKGELGLDHFEGRSWNGLHHHVSLVMLALAFLETQRATDSKKGRPNRKLLTLTPSS
jgi:SRSO17 transposase